MNSRKYMAAGFLIAATVLVLLDSPYGALGVLAGWIVGRELAA